MEEETICKSEKNELRKNITKIIIFVILLILAIIFITNIEVYDKPKMDKMAVEGTPEVEEKYEYSTLTINDGYEIGLCGNPKKEDNKIELYFTNMADNNVWIKVQILGEDEKILGETGIIQPNQFIKEIELNEEVMGEINIKIIEYEIDTYNSKGSVNLKI